MSGFGLGWKLPLAITLSMIVIFLASMLYLTEEFTLKKRAIEKEFYL